jgi:hypothetical protein
MTENTTIAHLPNEFPHVRVFELLPAKEFMVFFASSEGGLPDDHVRLELRVLALHDRKAEKRSVIGIIATDVISGAIGGAAWDAIKATYAALAEYLSRKHGTPVADAAAVVQRLTAASEKILGPEPPTLERLKLTQLKDNRWEAEFTRQRVAVRATLDPSGTIVRWSQRPRK